MTPRRWPVLLCAGLAVAAPAEEARFSLLLQASRPSMGLGYLGRDERGRVTFDARSPRADADLLASPWLGLEQRLGERDWLGGGLGWLRGDALGSIRARQSIGPLSYYVSRPMASEYRQFVGDIWYGRDFPLGEQFTLRPRVGLYLTHLAMAAAAEDVGRVRESAFGGLPLVGLDLDYRDRDVRWRLRADHGRLSVNDVRGRAGSWLLSREQALNKDWSWGVAWSSRRLVLHWDRPDYEADLGIRLRGVGVYSQHRF